MWTISHKYDRAGAALADGHYSRRTPGSPQFMPPGETLVLVTDDGAAVYGWWRPHPRAVEAQGLRVLAWHDLDGWTCSIFRNTGGLRSSELVLAAERELAAAELRGRTAAPCGKDGMLTWVWPRKLKPAKAGANPGWCFQVCGWTRDRWTAASQGPSRRKRLLVKPIELAGVPACAWKPDGYAGTWRTWFAECESRHDAAIVYYEHGKNV